MSSQRRQVYLAVAGSVGIHLAVLFAWACTVQWFPAAQAATSRPPEELQLEVVEQKPDVPPMPALTPTPPQLAFQDTADEATPSPVSSPPKDARFQSARDTAAASELAGAEDRPLPNQHGRRVPSFDFDSRPQLPGDKSQAPGHDRPENMPPPPAPETAPPPPRPSAPSPPPAATSVPTPVAEPSAKEPPVDPRDAALVAPRSIPSTPAEPEPNPYDPSFRPPVGMTEPPRPTPVARRGGFQPLQERTDASGNISKAGAGSVASEASPVGRYIASVKRAVSYRYNQYVDARADLASLGNVRVRFIINRDGKLVTSRVVSNTANEALASISLRALAEAQIPAMTEEVASAFTGGQLHMDINFGLE